MIRYTLDKANKSIAVSEHLYGLFFEDINQAADGGLNAEMVVNNSFEFEYIAYDPHNAAVPVAVRQMKRKYWDIFGAGPWSISTEGGMNANNAEAENDSSGASGGALTLTLDRLTM